jgi:hypothetical protein
MSVLDRDAADTIVFIDGCVGSGGVRIAYYGSVNEANNWFQQRLYNKPWMKSNPRQREAAIAEATQLIDNIVYWGTKTDENQSNEFPRNGATVVPLDVRRATYEIALALLDGVDIEREMRGLQITASGFAGARTHYDRTVPQEHIRNGIPSFKAWQLLTQYMADPNIISRVRVN